MLYTYIFISKNEFVGCPFSRISRKSARDGGASVTDAQAWKDLPPLQLFLSPCDVQFRFWRTSFVLRPHICLVLQHSLCRSSF